MSDKVSSSLQRRPSKRSSRSERKPRRDRREQRENLETVPDVSEVVETETTASMAAVAPVSEVVVETSEQHETSEVSRRSRRVVNREELERQFDELVNSLEMEVSQTKENKQRDVSLKTWKSLLKDVRRLKGDSLRCSKRAKRTTTNANAGFMKPVQISREAAKFVGVSPDELCSRVTVTRAICDYVRDNNLQNPENKRCILADKKLSKFLNYDPETASGPLTYPGLQKYMKHHFPKKSST